MNSAHHRLESQLKCSSELSIFWDFAHPLLSYGRDMMMAAEEIIGRRGKKEMDKSQKFQHKILQSFCIPKTVVLTMNIFTFLLVCFFLLLPTHHKFISEKSKEGSQKIKLKTLHNSSCSLPLHSRWPPTSHYSIPYDVCYLSSTGLKMVEVKWEWQTVLGENNFPPFFMPEIADSRFNQKGFSLSEKKDNFSLFSSLFGPLRRSHQERFPSSLSRF